MILECPACETRFLVDSSLIPAQGRDVKCAQCAHQWFVEADPDALPKMDGAAAEPEEEEIARTAHDLEAVFDVGRTVVVAVSVLAGADAPVARPPWERTAASENGSAGAVHTSGTTSLASSGSGSPTKP